MKHYDLTDGIDYLRGLGGPGRQGAIEGHLMAGCEVCRAMIVRLAALMAQLRADETVEPPVDVIRRARAVFVGFRPERVWGLSRIMARLVQDSLLRPLPAGIRGSERTSRQALYEAGDVYVDLRLEQRPGQPEIALVGQLLCPADVALSVARRPIVLTSGREVLTATSSNEHGEFHLEYIPAGRMRLHIPVEEGARRIEIALNPLMAPIMSRKRAAKRVPRSPRPLTD
ncbi:MAG TPA: hypothetical protein VGK32_05450 [Vicinamibacterales bacterium]|jgi:hypothetical protein